MSIKQNNLFAKKMEKLTSSNAMQDAKVICKTISLKVEDIDENPRNESIFNMDGIDELAAYIKDVGFYQPITVFQKSDGRYEILTGHRKFRAKVKNGDAVIDAIVRPAPKSDGDKMHQVIMDNFLARKLSPIDIARSMAELRDTWIAEGRNSGQLVGDTKEILATEFKMSTAKVSRYLRLLNLSPALQGFIANYSLSVDAALIMTETDNLSLDGLQDYIAKKIKETPLNDDGRPEINKSDIKKWIDFYKRSLKPNPVVQEEEGLSSEENSQKSMITRRRFFRLTDSLNEAFSADNISSFRFKDTDIESLKELRDKIDAFIKERE